MNKIILYAVLCATVSSLFAFTVPDPKADPVPKELIGHWQKGTFSMTNFWNPTTGQYLGNANEASVSYQISANGTVEEYFIYNNTSYNCRTQILGYRKGTLKIDAAEKTLTFCPTSGYYRTANCFNKEWKRKEYGEKDLCPQYGFTATWKVDGSNLILTESASGAAKTYKRIDNLSR